MIKREDKHCIECGTVFWSKVWAKKLCSRECRAVFNAKKAGRYVKGVTLPSGTVGAVAELVASWDLMIKGYAVFRALSPSCFCDLIAVKTNGQSLRVEVRTGYRSPASGKMFFPLKGREKIDIFAVVERNSRNVVYCDQHGAELMLADG